VLNELSRNWLDRAETEERIRRLVDAGFFEQRGSVTQRTYWVPFLVQRSNLFRALQTASGGFI
jgi:hypothetical protein